MSCYASYKRTLKPVLALVLLCIKLHQPGKLLILQFEVLVLTAYLCEEI